MKQEANRETFERDLREAMPYTNIPTLLLLLHQFTGQDRWLAEPFQPERSRGLDDNDTGGLAPEIQAQVREAAVEAILAWRDGSPISKPTLSGDELIEMMTVTEAEPIPADYASVMADKLTRYAGYAPEQIDVPDGFRVLIIGAGMSGVAAAIKLAQAGVPHTIIEKQDRAGGVWSSHSYPGCGVDTPGHLYSYTFAPGDWSMYFPLQEEIQGYFQRVAEQSGVADRIRFGTECITSSFDEETNLWRSGFQATDQNQFL